MIPILIALYFVVGLLVSLLHYFSSRGYEDAEDLRSSWGCLLLLGVPELALLAIAIWPIYVLVWIARKLGESIAGD